MSKRNIERNKMIKELYDLGYSQSQIANKFGLSRQRVHQILGKRDQKYFRYFDEKRCVYPLLRHWLNENQISTAELTRRLFGNNNPKNQHVVSNILKGGNCLKHHIDNLLKETEITYEEAFKRGV